MNKKKPIKKGRKPKIEATATVGIYLKPETYKRIKDQAEAKYASMSVIARQAIGKMIRSEVKI
jgi:predicted transcriptional regulator